MVLLPRNSRWRAWRTQRSSRIEIPNYLGKSFVAALQPRLPCLKALQLHRILIEFRPSHNRILLRRSVMLIIRDRPKEPVDISSHRRIRYQPRQQDGHHTAGDRHEQRRTTRPTDASTVPDTNLIPEPTPHLVHRHCASAAPHRSSRRSAVAHRPRHQRTRYPWHTSDTGGTSHRH